MKLVRLICTALLFVMTGVCASQADDKRDEEIPGAIGTMKFIGVRSVAAGRYERATSVGEFTVYGPVEESLAPLPHGIRRLAYDPRTKVYFGLGRQEVYELDFAHQKTTELKVQLDQGPQLSWPCGITFDTKRQRLIVSCLAGVGYIFGYSPTEKNWEVIGNAKSIDVVAIGYEEQNDRTYALYRQRRGPLAVCEINSPGDMKNGFELNAPDLETAVRGSPIDSVIQLIPLPGFLALIVSPDDHGRENQGLSQKIFVVNLKSRSVVKTWEE